MYVGHLNDLLIGPSQCHLPARRLRAETAARIQVGMRPILASLATALALVLSAAGAAAAEEVVPEGPPDAAFFSGAPGRTWLSGCELQSERYVVCTHAAGPVLDAIARAGAATPGAALEAAMRRLFEDKGCAFDAPPGTFRVNGIFLSFDSKSAGLIRCEGRSSDLVFRPGVIVLLDTLYFLAGDPPQ